MTEASDTGGPATYAHTQAPEHLIAEALGATYEATSGGSDHVKRAVESLISEARRTLEPALLPRVAPVIDQLSELAGRIDYSPGDVNDDAVALAENVYLVRGLLVNPEAALQLMDSRARIEAIRVPDSLPDLRLDLAVASEQLSYAALVPEPGRISAILAAVYPSAGNTGRLTSATTRCTARRCPASRDICWKRSRGPRRWRGSTP